MSAAPSQSPGFKGPWWFLFFSSAIHRTQLVLLAQANHSTAAAVRGGHSMVPASPECWGLH